MTRSTSLLKAALIVACFTPPLLDLAPGSGSVRGQSDAWVIGDQWARMKSPGAAIPLEALPQPVPNGFQDAKKYQGAIATRSSCARLNTDGDLMLFAIDGNIYDGDGYLIADGMGAGCQQCIEPGVAGEFLTIPVPNECGKYYVLTSTAKVVANDPIGLFLVALVDMNEMNPLWPNECRMGRILNLDDVVSGISPLYDWFSANGYSNYVAEFGNADNEIKTPYVSISAIDPGWANNELLVHVTTTDRLRQYKAQSTGITPTWTQFIKDLPAYYSKPESRDTDLGKDALTGELLFAVTDCQLADVYPNDLSTSRLLLLRMNPNTGTIVSKQNLEIDPLDQECGSTILARGAHGCAFSSNGQNLYFSSGTNNIKLGVIDLATTAVTNLTALSNLTIPNPSGRVLTHLNRATWIDGVNSAIYYAHANGVSALVGTNDPTTATWVDQVPFTQALNSVPLLSPVLSGNTVLPYMLDQQLVNDRDLTVFQQNPACCVLNETNQAICGHTFQSNNCTPLVWDQYSLLFGGGTTFTFSGDVIVPAGCQLQVTGKTLRFTPNARLIIKAGGSARFTNCTLTSLTCPGLRWPGVTVEGTTSADQYPLICGDQGFLDLKSTTISNAERGARCATEGTGGALLASGYGGVIYSSGSTFLNCIIGADLGDYHANFVGGVEDNLCYFSNTKFTIDNTWPDASQPSVQLYIHRTRKIRVFQCGFANDATTSIAGLGFGVVAQDAEVSVLGSILPNTSYVRNLVHGVWKFGGVLAPLTVNAMRFSNNQIGIRDDAGQWSRYTNNTFSVPDQNNYPQPRIGMQLWQSRFFTVERNTFTGQDPAIQPNENSIGIFFAGINPDQSTSWIYNDEQIYDNDFTDLYVGSLVNGIHRSDDGTKEDLGLKIFCGDYTNNVMDIGIAERSIIRPNQFDNSPQQLAGNRFYGAADCTNEFDWILDADWNQNVGAYNDMVITYLHHEDPLCFATCPDPVNDDFVDNPLLFSGLFVESDACGNGVLDLLHTPIQARQVYASAKQLCLEAKNLLDGATDGGERPDLIAELSQVDPALGTGFLRDRLMLNSPLSNEVLKAMILRELPMDPWHVTQVCLENSPLDPGILGLIRDQGHLDNFFMNVVDQAQSGQGPSAKQVLQQEWMLRRSQQARAFSELGWLWATDTITPGGDDSLRFALENHGGLDHTWSRIALRLAEGDLAGASALLGTMRDDQSGMPQLQAVIGFGYACNNDWALLDNASVDLMIAFASSGVQGAAIYAGILSAHGLAHVEPEVRFPNSERAMVLATADNTATGAAISITAYPTPADEETWLTFPTELKGMRFQVRDVQGKLVYEGRFESAGLHRLRTREFADGVYSIVPVGKSISGRVVIQH